MEARHSVLIRQAVHIIHRTEADGFAFVNANGSHNGTTSSPGEWR
jgi:predicted RNA binding protein YcfA (HicA-like mRNA interferase family)